MHRVPAKGLSKCMSALSGVIFLPAPLRVSVFGIRWNEHILRLLLPPPPATAVMRPSRQFVHDMSSKQMLPETLESSTRALVRDPLLIVGPWGRFTLTACFLLSLPCLARSISCGICAAAGSWMAGVCPSAPWPKTLWERRRTRQTTGLMRRTELSAPRQQPCPGPGLHRMLPTTAGMALKPGLLLSVPSALGGWSSHTCVRGAGLSGKAQGPWRLC